MAILEFKPTFLRQEISFIPNRVINLMIVFNTMLSRQWGRIGYKQVGVLH